MRSARLLSVALVLLASCDRTVDGHSAADSAVGPGGGRGGAGGAWGTGAVGGGGHVGAKPVVDAGADAAVDAGCDAACLATCGFVAADWMGGCVAPEGADAGPIEDGDTDVSGTIESISRVAPSNGCLRPLGYYAGAAEPVVLVVVAGDGSRWQVEYAVPTGYQPFQVGDTIEAKYSYWKGDWSPTVARLLLTRGGRTPVWTLLGGAEPSPQTTPKIWLKAA